MDPFLKHALTYAIYEIGELKRFAKTTSGDQACATHVEARQDDYPHCDGTLRLNLYKRISQILRRSQDKKNNSIHWQRFSLRETAQRGEKLFHNREKAKCVTCHLKGSTGVRLGPDLTRIGAIRSERDLLEAIVLPSASIARYHETVNVVTQ